MHGRDHRAEWDPTRHRFVGGADPTPLDVFLGPSPMMGNLLPGLTLANGFGTSGGLLWLPYREGVRDSGNALDTGELVEVAWSHADPRSDHFETVMARLHPIADVDAEIDLDSYTASDPWESSPWAGTSAFGYPGVGPGVALGTFAAPGGDWGGNNTTDWYGFIAISDADADTITFSGPGGWSEAAPYTYSLSGAGTIGYVFHKFNSSSSTAVSVTFASGTTASRSAGYVRIRKAAGVTPTVDADVGDQESNSTVRPIVTLTGNVPVTSGLLVVGAYLGPEGFDPSDAHKRPDVQATPATDSNKVPLYRVNKRNYLVTRYVGGLGQPGGTSGGGAPSGSAGGALDGTYPNPGLAASVAGAGLAESSDVLSVNVDNSTIEINSDTLRVKDGGITAAKVAADVATQAELDAHVNDTTDAHDASAISFSPTGSIAATDVQAAIAEVASEAGGGGGSELAYVERTSNLSVTATTAATSQEVVSAGAISFDGATIVMIEFFAPAVNPGADGDIVFNLFDGATDLGRIGHCAVIASGSTTGQPWQTIRCARRLTPSNASHTYKITAWRAAANGTVIAGSGGTDPAYLPAFIRIFTV